MNFKPMLAATLTEELFPTLRFPLLLSPKLDGFRCILWDGIAYSRNAKPIKNKFIQVWANDKHNVDGELIVGEPTGDDVFSRTSSGVTSVEGEPDFTYWTFDNPDRAHVGYYGSHHARPVPQHTVMSVKDIEKWEMLYLDQGYEGVMLRAMEGPYKNGRSTMNEQFLMKFKRFLDGEAVVIGVEEGRQNNNTPFEDELGRTKRQTLKANYTGSGMVGTLICRDPKWGEIRVAAGKMTHSERKYFYDWPIKIVGKVIHWRSFGYGTKDAPRFARYYGLRSEILI
jgi:DNA ligase-1